MNTTTTTTEEFNRARIRMIEAEKAHCRALRALDMAEHDATDAAAAFIAAREARVRAYLDARAKRFPSP